MKPKVLVVDDDDDIRAQMKWALTDDYDVVTAGDRRGAIEAFQQHRPDAVLLDLGLPPSPDHPVEGMSVLAGMLALDRSAKVLIISGQSDRAHAVKAIGAGAYDFLCKPLDPGQLRFLLDRCVHVAGLERDYRRLGDEGAEGVFEGMVGDSQPMREVFRTVEKVARAEVPVLILGESGTGKEMVAQAIHRRGRHPGRPFVAINCNAIPETLLESELFGHEKGAFTGAGSQRIGWVEAADGGTLFLDEIGDLPASVQVKLLRFLQEKCIQRVGGRQEIRVDARVIAATHVDLAEAVAGGRFREDLYFRLAVVVCKLPPLRERGDDVPRLARDFLERFAERNHRKGLAYDAAAIEAIRTHDWPGNVRELQNRVQRAVIMAEGRRITPRDLELGPAAGAGEEATEASIACGGLREARERLERGMVLSALARHDGNISAAAKELGISRPTFYELMSKLHLERG